MKYLLIRSSDPNFHAQRHIALAVLIPVIQVVQGVLAGFLQSRWCECQTQQTLQGAAPRALMSGAFLTLRVSSDDPHLFGIPPALGVLHNFVLHYVGG